MNVSENALFSTSKLYTNSYLIWIFILCMILTIISSITNTIVFHILLKSKFLIDQIFRYYLFATILDLIITFMLFIRYSLALINWSRTDLFCKIFEYWLNIFYSFHPWISVITAVDRLLCLKYPTEFDFHKKFENQAKVIGLTFLLLVFINIPNYLYYEVSIEIICEIDTQSSYYYNNLSNLLFSNILPFLIAFIIMTVVLNDLRKKKLVPGPNNLINLKKEIRFFKILLTMNSVFLIGCLPISVTNFIKSIFDVNGIKYDYWSQVNDSAVFLIMFKTSSTIFIYFVDKSFKNELLLIIKFLKINRENFRLTRGNRRVAPL